MDKTAREILEILRCDIINSVEDQSIGLTEEMVRQREFIDRALQELYDLLKEESNSKIVELLKQDQKLNVALNDFAEQRIGKGIVYTRIAQFANAAWRKSLATLLGREKK